MPRVLSRQPAWLDHGKPGFDFFQQSQQQQQPERRPSPTGPLRRIAHRGTQLFVAVGHELRWSDLSLLQAAGSQSQALPAYKTLKTPAARSIQQISVSPSGDFIAVLTSHTCHVCLLPSSDHLKFQDSSPLKLRSYTVGPTAHVLEQSPLASVIWHPLSPSGNCLVTITRDACVRLWELDHSNRSSFNEPALAVDLKKLVNASSTREDFSASKYGTNKGFSPDDVEMEVAAGCFGGTGDEDEDGWSAMTLWVAMTEGDVYALCPFLPSHFWVPTTCLPSLSTSVVARHRVLSQPNQGVELAQLVASHQSAWLGDLDDQDPTTVPGPTEIDVYRRPTRLGAIPRLQGPFQLVPEPDFGEITDIHVIAAKTDSEDLFDDEEVFSGITAEDGLSVGIVCLATTTSKVHVCLNVEGVEAEWLPSRSTSKPIWNDSNAVKEMLLFETVDLAVHNPVNAPVPWPTFTPSPVPGDRYQFFTTQPSGVYALSVLPWATGLENELSTIGSNTGGIAFRMNVLVDSSPTTVESVTSHFEQPHGAIDAAVVVFDERRTDMGCTVLTTASNQPFVAVLEHPSSVAHRFEPDSNSAVNHFTTAESRAPYQPAEAFFQLSAIPAQLEAWRRESSTTGQSDIRGSVQFTSDTLSKITDAHRVLSGETHTLGLAAADLFRRCERMMSEMKAQVEKVRELSNRINSVTGEDEFPEHSIDGPALVRGGKRKIETRLQHSQAKSKDLKDRVEALQRKTRSLGTTIDLSDKERAFAEEVQRIEHTILPSTFDAPTSPAGILKMENSDLTVSTESRSSDEAGHDTIAQRFTAVEEVYDQLKLQMADAQKALDTQPSRQSVTGGAARATDYRQLKLQQVFALLERETALVDAVSERLERLQMGTQ